MLLGWCYIQRSKLFSVGKSLQRTCCVLCLVAQLHPTVCNPMACHPPGSSVLRDSLGKNTGVGCHALLQGIFPTQGSNPGLLHCRQILYQEPSGKPNNPGVGSPSLLQGIFPTQELNPGLLRCRWILYQLSYKGSPQITKSSTLGSQRAFLVFKGKSLVFWWSRSDTEWWTARLARWHCNWLLLRSLWGWGHVHRIWVVASLFKCCETAKYFSDSLLGSFVSES